MKNMFYVPQIQEFHVGFEYEYLMPITNGFEWQKQTFDKLDLFFDLKTLEKQIAISCRVKHLDKDDIESLGFEYTYKFGYEKNSYTLWVEDNNMVRIEVMGDYDGEEPHFYGTIKNKSELKRLLVQLGIK